VTAKTLSKTIYELKRKNEQVKAMEARCLKEVKRPLESGLQLNIIGNPTAAKNQLRCRDANDCSETNKQKN